MLPFDGEGHSWRFSDVCRVTQLWLKAFSLGKIKEVWGGEGFAGGGTGTPAALARRQLQISAGADSTPTCTTSQVLKQKRQPSLKMSNLAQIAPDSNYINPSAGISIRSILADH